MKQMVSILALMMASQGFPSAIDFAEPKEKPVKNKYGLSLEDIEKMKSMTPKEKKKFLKDREK